ncbi:MAG: winged helix-turn-helix transcriptional regulator [Promethearchaeota archaeon]
MEEITHKITTHTINTEILKLKPHEISCPIYLATRLLGKRWTLNIIAQLMQVEMRRFGELKRKIDYISPKVLTQRLKELEDAGIVDRQVYDDSTPIKVTYSLTDKGRDLHNVLDALRIWGERWGDNMNPCTHLNCSNCVYPIKKPSLDAKTK